MDKHFKSKTTLDSQNKATLTSILKFLCSHKKSDPFKHPVDY